MRLLPTKRTRVVAGNVSAAAAQTDRTTMEASVRNIGADITHSLQATSRCSPGEQRPPIHDGGDSRIGSDRNKKALAVPVDCVRTVVADNRELFPK